VDEGSSSDLTQAAETTVIALACAGNCHAFGELVRRRQHRVRSFLYYLCRNSAEGDDLAQQVFLKAWQSIRQLRAVAAFDGWLKKIMVTTWLEAVRRRKITSTDDLESSEARGSYLHSTGEKIDLEVALSQLPPAMRLCIVLAYDDGMTHEEIAALTDSPIGTVKSNISRGTARMKEILFDYQNRSKR